MKRTIGIAALTAAIIMVVIAFNAKLTDITLADDDERMQELIDRMEEAVNHPGSETASLEPEPVSEEPSIT